MVIPLLQSVVLVGLHLLLYLAWHGGRRYRAAALLGSGALLASTGLACWWGLPGTGPLLWGLLCTLFGFLHFLFVSLAAQRYWQRHHSQLRANSPVVAPLLVGAWVFCFTWLLPVLLLLAQLHNIWRFAPLR